MTSIVTDICILYSRCPQIQGLPEIREFLQSSPPSRTYHALSYQQHVTPHMHHVLVDWLCEVANIRLHNSQILHAATQVAQFSFCNDHLELLGYYYYNAVNC